MGFIDLLGKEHEQAGHEGEYGKQAAQDCFYEDGTHIAADAELHKHHGDHTGNRGQGAGGDFGDCLGESDNDSIVSVEVFAFFGVAVA